jgi:hypothetical protein
MRLRYCLYSLMILLSVTQAHAKKADPALLFFQHASAGTIQPDENKGCYQLRLNGLDKDVIYLSNSPDEITGRLTIPIFVSSWQHQQATESTKPNAILHADFVTNNKKILQVSDVFIIKRISYQASDNTMLYRICRFKDETTFRMGKFQDINIFVDPFHRWPP